MNEKKLKVLIITQGVSRVVEPLLKSNHEVIGFLESASRAGGDKDRRVLFSVVKNIYSFFKKKVVSLESVAEEYKLPYRFMTSSDDPGLVEWVSELNPDVIVVFSMSQLLKEKIFSIPRYGTINLHPAMLPEYRGPNPDFWQYYNFELSPGVTVHYIDKGEDTGDIIYQERTEVPLGIKSPEQLDILIGRVGVSLILKALDAIKKNNAPKIKQPEISPTVRARNILPEEHESIIDWESWPVYRVWHVLRGTELWLNVLPQPKGFYMGQRWSVDEYELFGGQTLRPGSIYKRDGRHCVAVKEGCIYLSCNFKLKNLLIRFLKR